MQSLLIARLLASSALLALAPAHPAAPPSQSAEPVVLVELFTSEGCSSCPPADALLRQVHGTLTGGRRIIALSEHVTYWNQLGWHDPFSSDSFTERQNRYSERFGLDSVYTPQMVVDGRVQMVGNDRAALQRALLAESKAAPVSLHLLASQQVSGGLDLRFRVESAEPLDIYAVLTDDHDRTEVQRGENGGHTLEHVSVARVFARVAQVHDSAEHATHLPVPEALLRDGKGHHVVLFAQQPGQRAVVGAVTATL